MSQANQLAACIDMLQAALETLDGHEHNDNELLNLEADIKELLLRLEEI